VRIEVKAKLPAGIGSFPAIMAIGDGQWPQSGALALVEQFGQDKTWAYLTAYADSSSHGATGNVTYNYSDPTSASANFHVYAVDWYSDHLVFQVDGRTVVSKPFDSGAPFATIPEYLTLDVALGGSQGGAVDNGGFPMTMTVDYVRVYSLP
jgi:beta-glucanase (GH16 family)